MIRILYSGYRDHSQENYDSIESFLKNFFGKGTPDDVMIRNVRRISDVKLSELNTYKLIIADHLYANDDFKRLSSVDQVVKIIMTSTERFPLDPETDPEKPNIHYVNKINLATAIRLVMEHA